MTEKRLLQSAILVFGLVPVLAGLAGMILGAGFIADAADPSLDSHVRYLSGLLFGIGVAFWTSAPRIETMGSRFRLLTAVVFAGGLARLVGIVVVGIPSNSAVLALGMELVVTPLLCLWQARVAHAGVQDARTNKLNSRTVSK
ncbi:DUF4345 domain-containing protein [Roseicella sp. DB1501]|uniref:DUF4345 domain-containing protein n=1 Tax=Roseicella sp. DB1501 TaxID=2730925 RepID=UPI00349FF5F6